VQQQQQQQQQQHPPTATSPGQQQYFTDTSFQDFANLDKVDVTQQQQQHHQPSQPHQQPGVTFHHEQDFGADGHAEPMGMQQEPASSATEAAAGVEGYVSVEDELADLGFKLERLRKKGLPVRSFVGSVSELKDMRAEFNRIRSEIEFENSLKFGKKALCGVVSVIEWLNQKYQPFDLQLEGWSESIMTNVDSYENTLERLIIKYRNRISTPPELELALSLAASGLMYHMTNAMFKQAMLPGASNPDLIKSMMGAFSSANNAAPPPPPPPQPMSSGAKGAGYQMKGPGINLGAFMPTPMPYPVPANPPPADRMHQQQPTPPMSHLQPSHNTQQQVSTPTPLNDDDNTDRLSDVASEDMQSIRSLDLESIQGSLRPTSAMSAAETKSIKIPASIGVKRQRLQARHARAQKTANSSIKTFDI
jgi:hypothetical protein